MGAGTSSGKASSAGVYASAASKYQNIADSNNAKLASKPNNLTYKETADLYSGLAKAAKSMNPSSKTFSGAKAAVALDNAPIGTRVEIRGTGNGNDGIYVKGWWTKSGYTPGQVWRRQGPGKSVSFASTPAQITSTLNLIKGGQFVDDRSRTIKFL